MVFPRNGNTLTTVKIVIVILVIYFIVITRKFISEHMKISERVVSPYVHIVPNSPSRPLSYKDCVPLPQSPRPDVRICIHPVHKDIWISGALKAGRLWEHDLVNSMRRVLKENQDMQLLDIGANIGEFTLMAAAMGRHVLAVEMLPQNIILLQTSLAMSNLGENVTLVHNALYNDYRNMSVILHGGNVGGTSLAKAGKTNKTDLMVRSIVWDDLIPLVVRPKVYVKMDIELSEAAALSRATEFFKQVNVSVVHMEWNGGSKDRKQINKFMQQHGYVASKSAQRVEEITNVVSIPKQNIFFLKI